MKESFPPSSPVPAFLSLGEGGGGRELVSVQYAGNTRQRAIIIIQKYPQLPAKDSLVKATSDKQGSKYSIYLTTTTNICINPRYLQTGDYENE